MALNKVVELDQTKNSLKVEEAEQEKEYPKNEEWPEDLKCRNG